MFLYVEFIRSKIYQNLETEVSMKRVIFCRFFYSLSVIWLTMWYLYVRWNSNAYGSYTMSHIFKKI